MHAIAFKGGSIRYACAIMKGISRANHQISPAGAYRRIRGNAVIGRRSGQKCGSGDDFAILLSTI